MLVVAAVVVVVVFFFLILTNIVTSEHRTIHGLRAHLLLIKLTQCIADDETKPKNETVCLSLISRSEVECKIFSGRKNYKNNGKINEVWWARQKEKPEMITSKIQFSTIT